MHSSRMRTGHSLTVCWGGGVLPAGGSPCPGGLGGFSLPRGRGASLPEGVSLPGGLSLLGGFSLPGEGLPAGGSPCWGASPYWGVGLPARGVRGSPCRGVSLPRGSPGPETPPVNRITHTCKNITLATTSLRPVITWNRKLLLQIHKSLKNYIHMAVISFPQLAVFK